ncbi:hypothetical protein [Brevibacterium moorei]|uniref:hypothetical protein n=1 Tax=Brevibacterium moorei TaxID=2968457 RepID=UPI00211BEF5D|nr:hypothetical protein [Brevibacterium sp. 68QC2CO]MCQ9385108.1 hypothetical protein [Brevibacterium sp. 68QC2CO]
MQIDLVAVMQWAAGGGLGVLVVGLWNLIKDWRSAGFVKEDRAVEQYKDLRMLAVDELRETQRSEAWYRDHYVALWVEVVRAHPDMASRFPAGPPAGEAGKE